MLRLYLYTKITQHMKEGTMILLSLYTYKTFEPAVYTRLF